MRTKVKWFLITGLVTLLVIPLLGCAFMETLITPSPLSDVQVIGIIITAGVPYTDHYYKELVGEEQDQASGDIGRITPTGKWAATYQGKGKWMIQGPVVTKKWGECLTTWTFRLIEDDTEIKLVGFSCD